MTTAIDGAYRSALHPVHAVLLAGSLPLFLGALLSDLAYSASYQIQWTNFASWLIASGLVFVGFALLWAVVDLFRARRGRRSLVYVLLLVTTWILGFTNALVHAKDAWATMPEALILSIIVALLALAATYNGYSQRGNGEVK